MPATLILTTLAMLVFAANSLFARLALADDAIDAAGYTGVRLISGALVLAVLLMWRSGRRGSSAAVPGNWISALALFAYAFTFSLAYVRLGVTLGALVLFTSVQITMILWGLIRGERPGYTELFGFAIAFAGFVYLVSPGLAAPDPVGSGLMVISGIAWGAYSLRGRSGADATAETAGNFIRAAPMSVPLIAISVLGAEVTSSGIALSLASGVLASGLGYVVWYRALPGLTTTQSAIVQLTAPVIAAFGGIVFLSEMMTVHLLITGTIILGGVALAILSRKPNPALIVQAVAV